ncbi:MAG: outer membrane beta-barrel protein [Deltaproteobacteria bacterium]|nr:outer membrane beta-barrel protein [Deltaproteobacteria bacterium]
MKKLWILCLLLILAPCLACAGQTPIGKTKTAQGQVLVLRSGGARVPLRIGDPLYQNDTLRTGANGSVGILFEDDTILSLGPNSELTIDGYVFAPEQGLMSMISRMIKGTASYMSGVIGKQAPEAVRFQTPDATIALRGTHFLVKVEQPEPRLAYDWSGAFLGAMLGYSWMPLDYHEPDYPGYQRHPTLDGFNGGALLGCNFQRDRLVFGLEADGALGDLKESAHRTAFNDYSAFKISWNAHLRLKTGIAFDTTQFYVAGGLALAEVTLKDTDPRWGNGDAIHAGWTIGAGIEQALGKNLRLRLEYLYDDYGDKSYRISGINPYRAEIDLTGSTVRAALCYRF